MLNFKGLKIFSDTINTERGDKMLNQFTGIGKVESKATYWNNIRECNMVMFNVQLCSGENARDYEFYGKTIAMMIEEDKKNKKIEKDSIVAFNGSYIDDSDTLVLKSIKVV